MNRPDTVRTDVLVIGAGIAGLRAAAAAAQSGKKVTVVSKGPRCSYGVMGFNAAVGGGDSAELYYEDILRSGCGLSDRRLARLLADGSFEQLRFLEENGLSFDRTETGEYDLLQPLGCSLPRLVHAGRFTGTRSEELLLRMLESRSAELAFDITVLDLLSDGERVYGALAAQKNKLLCFSAGSVIVAAGGAGSLYPVTTYPSGIQGDSYAMLARAGAELTDMEFMQFEPCCLAEPAGLRGRGISTTMLNAGARLLNANGKEFLHKYIPDLKKMQKSNLARAMFSEMEKQNGAPLLYDVSMIAPAEMELHCLWLNELRAAGYDSQNVPLKVCPAAHTFLGGAKVDERCAASLAGLYAAGEAMGGLHGANRIGGCAGAEIYVFGALAGQAAAADAIEADVNRAEQLAAALLESYAPSGEPCGESVPMLIAQLQSCAASGLSIIRSAAGIKKAAELSHAAALTADHITWSNAAQLTELSALKNMALLMQMIAAASLSREESRGVFFRSDFPAQSDLFEHSFTVSMADGAIKVE